jgi:hypothetical protein
MSLFTMEEIENAFDALVAGKLRNRRRSIAFETIGYRFNGANTSVLPIGSDGVTTMHVLKTPEKKAQFLNEIYRLTNQNFEETDIPRIKFKKFKVKTIKMDETKSRTVVIPCLRDQVVVRCILNKLNEIGITDEANKPNPKVIDLTKRVRNLILSGNPKKIIRTDITNYYPSISPEKLIQKLEASHGHVIDPRIMNLIRKILLENESKHKYTGIPLGVGFCVLLANYYISQMKLADHFHGIEIIRYEDDVMFIVEKHIDENEILARLDAIYEAFGIKRSEAKTEVMDAMSDFKFIGVNYANGKVFVSEEKMNKWKVSVADDVKKQFRDYSILKAYYPDADIPSNKELVNRIWGGHKRGVRSKTFPHSIRVKNLNDEPID